MKQGQVFKIHSDFYYVDEGGQTHECKIREVLKKRKEKVLTGDFVEFENGVIEKILPRKNFIPRPAAANIDRIIIVSAFKEPDLNLTQLDRYIALAKYYGIETVLCFNKEDLLEGKRARGQEGKLFEKNEKVQKESLPSCLPAFLPSIYEPLGFEIVFTSAKENEGIDEFMQLLSGKTSVLCGNSGVGKSSLINAILPELNLKIGAVSEKTQRGTHTTRHCEIIKLEGKRARGQEGKLFEGKTQEESLPSCLPALLPSRIIDTPGFSNVKFDFLLPHEIGGLFDDIAGFAAQCKFSDCLHTNETGCNVLVNLDKIPRSRYESYLEFVEEARAYKEKIKYEGRKEETFKKSSGSREAVKISGKKRQAARNTAKQRIYKEADE